MGRKTKGVDAFKKHINATTQKTRKSSADEHEKAFEGIKAKSDPIKGIKVKTVRF
jgi:hypothetical protein